MPKLDHCSDLPQGVFQIAYGEYRNESRGILACGLPGVKLRGPDSGPLMGADEALRKWMGADESGLLSNRQV